MKKLLLFSLTVLMFIDISAQKKYTYLQGQTSPFNGEFNEPRYKGVDSISYIYYEKKPITQTNVDEIPELVPIISSYILVKNSADELSDTLRYNNGEGFDKYIKKYSEDGKLVYSSSEVHDNNSIDIEKRKFVYDAEERISEISMIKNRNGDATVMVYDTIKYDYVFKPYLGSVTIKYNTIYTQNDSILVFYSDDQNLYETIEHLRTTDETTTQYIFDDQNRLIKKTISYYTPPKPTSGDNQEYRTPDVFDYEYTDNGYKIYENEGKTTEYNFQNDGYCTEIIYYEQSMIAVYPPLYVVAIEKFSYCKNGTPIVGNEPIEQKAPKVYGTQGGIVVNTETSLPVSIYMFSGALVKKEIAGAGNQIIPLSKGFYIVTIGNMSYKVLVR